MNQTTLLAAAVLAIPLFAVACDTDETAAAPETTASAAPVEVKPAAEIPVADDPIDFFDATSVAKATLTAFRDKDFGTLALLSAGNNREFFEAMKAEGESHRGWDQFFGDGWRAEAIRNWDGTLDGPRYETRGDDVQAFVAFGSAGDETMVVVLNRAGKCDWRIEDINSPSTAHWESMSTEMPSE